MDYEEYGADARHAAGDAEEDRPNDHLTSRLRTLLVVLAVAAPVVVACWAVNADRAEQLMRFYADVAGAERPDAAQRLEVLSWDLSLLVLSAAVFTTIVGVSRDRTETWRIVGGGVFRRWGRVKRSVLELARERPGHYGTLALILAIMTIAWLLAMMFVSPMHHALPVEIVGLVLLAVATRLAYHSVRLLRAETRSTVGSVLRLVVALATFTGLMFVWLSPFAFLFMFGEGSWSM